MKTFECEPTFCKTTLENGVRVITEHHPYSRTVSSGIFLDLGSRDEGLKVNGVAHFIEHLVFRGTHKRSAYEIVQGLESLGGELNAYTSRESTCFHASCLREHVNLSLDILTDLVSNAQLQKKDFEKERTIILQEIDMAADLLEEHIFDLYFQYAFKGHSLAQPILGSKDSLNQLTLEELSDFYKTHYQNLVVGVSGNLDHNDVVKEVSRHLNFQNQTTSPKEIKRQKPPSPQGFTKIITKPSEQVHLLLGLPSSSYHHKSRFASYVVNTYLGGGMTSKLYQIVREKYGYAYSIYSYLHPFIDSGLILFYAGTSKNKLTAICEIILKEIQAIKDKGISKKDLEYFRTQVIGNIILGADDVENRMNSLGTNEITYGQHQPVEKIIEQVSHVSCEDVQQYVDEFFDLSKLGTLVIGDIDSKTKLHSQES